MYAPKPLRPIWPPPVKPPARPKARDREAGAAHRRQPIPLTHHEILALAEPLTRRGRHVDLAGSDRLARRIRFKPTTHRSAPDGDAELVEILVLDNPDRRSYRLTRWLTDSAGRVATLRGEGMDLPSLVEAIDRVDPRVQFPILGGVPVARSDRLDFGTPSEQSPRRPCRLVFRRAVAEIEGIEISLDAEVGHGMPAELLLRPTEGRRLCPPEDLLAVLGWAWRSLRPTEGGWRSSLRIAAGEPARTPDVEAKLQRTLEHLAATLGAPPADFHRTWRRRRWWASARGLLAWAGVATLFGMGPALLLLGAPEGSLLRLLSFLMPAFLILILIARHETPRMKRPTWPRPLSDEAWTPTERHRAGT